jgi:hypothetical protein
LISATMPASTIGAGLGHLGFAKQNLLDEQHYQEASGRERVVIEAPTSCSCCGSDRIVKMGEDITETLEVIPRQWKVIQTVREKFTCRMTYRVFRTFAGSGLQVALVAPGAGVLARLAALVAACPAQPIRLRVQHRVQGFLDRAAHHLAKVIPDPRLVDLDHLAHRLHLHPVVHAQLLSAILKGTASLGKCAKDSVRYLLHDAIEFF